MKTIASAFEEKVNPENLDALIDEMGAEVEESYDNNSSDPTMYLIFPDGSRVKVGNSKEVVFDFFCYETEPA